MRIKEHIQKPEVILQIIMGVFGLGAIRATLNFQIQNNDERLDTFEAMHIDVAIMKIQTDLTWIRKSLENE